MDIIRRVVRYNAYITDQTLIKHEKETGKLRMNGGSWTINLDKFPIDTYTKIVYITEKFRYEIDTTCALNNGFIKNFRGENKLIVPIKHWSKNAISI